MQTTIANRPAVSHPFSIVGNVQLERRVSQ
jgi:hypothetical protein